MSVKTSKKETKGSRMYVGPTIPGLAIQNRVYSEMPPEFVEAKKKVPELVNLFVPVIKYTEAERMIRERKGYIYSAYVKALEYKEGGK